MSPSGDHTRATSSPKGGGSSPPVKEVKAGVFKNTCLELMDEVRDRQSEIVITKHGAPVARLVAPDVQAPSAFGFMRGTLLGHGDIVSPDSEPWGEFGG